MLSIFFDRMGKKKMAAEEKRLKNLAEKVNALEWVMTGLSEKDFTEEVESTKAKIRTLFMVEMENDAKKWACKSVSEKPEVIKSVALAKEAVRRVKGLRLHDVQIMGAFVLREGRLAEMKTGEGKTLVAMTAASTDAMAGLPCHVVTVNDYLARRDALDLAPIYSMLGLRVGLLQERQGRDEKRHAYSCDVIYGVNHEFGFDYLRDRTATEKTERFQGRLGSAIVDEVDSILIDEARTPLILSGQDEEDLSSYPILASLCGILPKKMVEVDEKAKQAHLTEEGFEWFETRLLGMGLISHRGELYEFGAARLMRALQATVNARFVFKKDVDYIVSPMGEIVIIDERTGRAMEGRRWSDGLHQAMEAKEGVEVKQENKTLASVTYQNFFRMYGKLSGLTGTAMTQAGEFKEVYDLMTIPVPTHKPVMRVDLDDLMFRSAKEKFEAIAVECEHARSRGQPVLIGTASVEDSEILSGILLTKGISHEVLNAKQHEREALIIEAAGSPGAITVATNMAGRGTDVELGGSRKALLRIAEAEAWDMEKLAEAEAVWKENHEKVVAAGGLFVIGAARNESRRVDLQLRGRAGRQGDPGRSCFYVSLEDDLFRIYGENPFLKKLAQGDDWPYGVPMEHPLLTKALAKAQERVENHHASIRGRILEYDEPGDLQRKAYYGWREEFLESENPTDFIEEMVMESLMKSVELEAHEGGGLPENWGWERAAEICFACTGGFFVPPHFGEETLDRWEWSASIVGLELGKMAAQAIKESIKEQDFESARVITLSRMDSCWQDHLTGMSEMMQGIHLRSYAQSDPRREFKMEAFKRFKAMREAMSDECAFIVGTWLRERRDFLAKAEQAVIKDLEGIID